jgi:hypothetical protein
MTTSMTPANLTKGKLRAVGLDELLGSEYDLPRVVLSASGATIILIDAHNREAYISPR